MKKYVAAVIMMFNTFFSYAQTADKKSYEVVIDKIKLTYNNKDYTGFYNLLSPFFKSQQSEKEIESFLKDNVYAYFGNIISISYLNEKEGFKHYKMECEKGNLEMLLVCNEKLLIEGFSLVPYEEKVVSEKKEFLSNNKKQTKLDLKVDSIVSDFMSNPINCGLSIGIIQNGQTHIYHYGETKKGTNQLPSDSSLYEIGSISKTFTGILLAQALIENKISLSDDIRKYLPKECSKLCYNNHPVTVKHLVTHSSGIPRIPENIETQLGYDPLNPYKNYNKEMVYDYLSTLKLYTVPGNVIDYSNTGMALLGIILETIYSKTYAELLNKYIAIPTEMRKTFVNIPEYELKNFVNGYNDKGEKTPHWDLGDQAGAGGIKSSIKDMSLYLQNNISEEMPAIKKSHEFQLKYNTQSIALAWFIQKTKSGNTLYWHNGGTFGFSSFCGFIKENKCGVVVLNNSGNSVDDIAITILKHIQ